MPYLTTYVCDLRINALRKWGVVLPERFEQVPAVYKITNTRNGKFYIGSTMNLVVRVHTHFVKLRGKRHVNEHWQNAFNKSADWKVTILVYTPEDLATAEQFWLDELQATKNGYNIAMYAYKPAILTPAVAKKVGMALKARWAKLSPEERKRSNIMGTEAFERLRAALRAAWTDARKAEHRAFMREWMKQPKGIAQSVALGKWQTGKPKSAAAKINMRAAQTLRWSSEDERLAQSIRTKLNMARPEIIARYKGPKNLSPVQRKAASDRAKKRLLEHPEHFEKLTRAREEWWAVPENAEQARKKQRAAVGAPEFRKMLSEKTKKKIEENPEILEALQAGRAAHFADPVKSLATLAKRAATLRSEPVRKKNSENAKRHLEKNPDAQKNLQAARIAYWDKPENRAAAAERARLQMTERWKDPEVKAKILAKIAETHLKKGGKRKKRA